MKNRTLMPLAAIDPVCGMKVEPDSHYLAYIHEARTYHFCAESCRRAFVTNPDRYLTGKPDAKKGWWGRYVDRLNKATGGKAMKCCKS